MAKDADDLVIATDYDREGELIGMEALHEILESNPRCARIHGEVKRAKYSALTQGEIESAFDDLDHLSYPLADAGEARQDMDLIWGATLTRAVSSATRRFGSNFLSVGRVQSPTLGLIVERELERRAHVPKPFWEVTATFAHPDGNFEAEHTADKFWKKEEAEAASPTPRVPARSRRSAPGRTRASRRRPSTPPPSQPTPRAGWGSPPRARCGSPRTSTWTGTSPTRAQTTPSIRSRSTPVS